MSQAAALVTQLETSHKYIRSTISIFEEEDAGFAPQPDLYTVAGHIAHAADSVEWFVEGAFGKGWNMDFEGLIAAARAVETLEEAVAWLDRAFETAIAAFRKASDEDLGAKIPDERIMGGAPRSAIVGPIVDHTAHHRGALTVYARLLGKVPKMIYS
ncbi:MAG: DinB family protein [Gemmatimonadota bacterium]|nr:DinB family protein [Gemmatimonadota bacterium]MDE2985401.1 DinB family protein [Gemmatimonadota bacterium]